MYDGIVTRKVVNELKDLLLGGKIQKINQPSKNDIVFNIYSRGKTYKLLLSANNNEARVNLTKLKYENPDKPPNFCMVLRKHINQGKIIDISQKGLDRVIIFSISSIDELGFDKNKKLIVEIMGKYSNIILVDEDMNIIDAIKRVNDEMSSVREILPSLPYEFIGDDKVDISEESFDKDIFTIDQKLPDNQVPYKIFQQNYTGFSPSIGKELIARAGIDDRINWGLVSEDEKERLNSELINLRDKIKNNDLGSFSYSNTKKVKDFHTIRLSNLALEEMTYPTMSQAIEEYFTTNKTHDRLNQMKSDLNKKINSNIKSVLRKKKILSDNLDKKEKIDSYKRKGDLLAANVYKINKGDSKINLVDFYDNNKEVEVPIDPSKNPWDNVKAAYDKSKKLKASYDYAIKDMPKQDDLHKYLLQVQDFINRSESIDDLLDIREELEDARIIKKNSKSKKIHHKKSKPYHYVTANGSDIFVGKNSKQNDELTLKFANKDDIWFHIKDLAGSHVILRNDNINEEDIHIGAYLAAINSSIPKGIKVDVDYTEKKNVNKAKGAKPGMVYYNDFKTIRVDTSVDLSDKFEVKK
ncbi:MAG: NFACT RNA binding domain-containing protein [Peptoniphilaceae bacterium]|nr:NFACT RNA binding domain-containing protein [Peptoniphilaceae bacterium]